MIKNKISDWYNMIYDIIWYNMKYYSYIWFSHVTLVSKCK